MTRALGYTSPEFSLTRPREVAKRCLRVSIPHSGFFHAPRASSTGNQSFTLAAPGVTRCCTHPSCCGVARPESDGKHHGCRVDGDRIGCTLARIAHEIVGTQPAASMNSRLSASGRRGVPLAKRLAGLVGEIVGAQIPIGALDITLYRDDLMRHRLAISRWWQHRHRCSIDDRRILPRR